MFYNFKSSLKEAIFWPMIGATIALVVVLLFSALFAQQQPTKLQQAMAEITRLNVVLEDVKTERNALIVRVAELTKNAIAINDGILKATQKLQKGYNDGKLNYEELRLMGFDLVVDSTSVYKRPDDKAKKDKKD